MGYLLEEKNGSGKSYRVREPIAFGAVDFDEIK